MSPLIGLAELQLFSHLIHSLLFEVRLWRTLTIAAVLQLLVSIALIACYIPVVEHLFLIR